MMQIHSLAAPLASSLILAATAVLAGPAAAQNPIPGGSGSDQMRYVRPVYYAYGHAGAAIGGDRDLNQTAGGFDGRIWGGSGPALGVTGEATLYRFGMPTHETFGIFEIQGRVTFDYMETRGLSVTPNGGGTGGSMDNSQMNFMGGVQLRTPIRSGPVSSLDLYTGILLGAARVSAGGSPVSGVTLQGSDTSFAVRALAGLDIGLGGPFRAGIEYSYQYTGATEFSTNFAGERFRQSSYSTNRVVARFGIALGGNFQPYYRSLTMNDRTMLGQATYPAPPPPPP